MLQKVIKPNHEEWAFLLTLTFEETMAPFEHTSTHK